MLLMSGVPINEVISSYPKDIRGILSKNNETAFNTKKNTSQKESV
jgi:hypothetical protein